MKTDYLCVKSLKRDRTGAVSGELWCYTAEADLSEGTAKSYHRLAMAAEYMRLAGVSSP